MMLFRNFLLRNQEIPIPVYWKAAAPSKSGSSYNSILPKTNGTGANRLTSVISIDKVELS